MSSASHPTFHVQVPYPPRLLPCRSLEPVSCSCSKFHAYDRCPDSCRSTCFGPGKFSVQDMNTPEFVSPHLLKATADFQDIRRVFILNLKGVVDIRASNMQGNEAVLGLLPFQRLDTIY